MSAAKAAFKGLEANTNAQLAAKLALFRNIPQLPGRLS
jgi:hypothetical protein